jgi:hypothetical protein
MYESGADPADNQKLQFCIFAFAKRPSPCHFSADGTGSAHWLLVSSWQRSRRAFVTFKIAGIRGGSRASKWAPRLGGAAQFELMGTTTPVSGEMALPAGLPPGARLAGLADAVSGSEAVEDSVANQTAALLCLRLLFQVDFREVFRFAGAGAIPMSGHRTILKLSQTCLIGFSSR